MNLKIYIHFLFFLLITPIKILHKQKNIINISFAIDNKYTHTLLVPLVSLLKNSDNNSIYHIYILVGETFKQENYKLICDLEKVYFNCFIHIINLGNEFQDAYKKKFIDTSTYYRLNLPNICFDINRIIYIVADTVILKDLIQLYTLNFENKYILGKLDKYGNELDKLNININNYINCGVLLMDLYSLRKYGHVNKFMEYINMHNNKEYLKSQDQTLINYICHDKIGILKPKYHMWPYKNIEKCLEDNKKLRIPYNEFDISDGFYNPFIIHFPGEFKFRKSFINDLFYKDLYEYTILSVKIRLKLEKMN